MSGGLGCTGSYPVVVIGAGPVGLRFAESLLARVPQARVVILGDEVYAPYDRVHLGRLLQENLPFSALLLPVPERGSHLEIHTGQPVVAIDRMQQQVHTANGYVQAYSCLVLATGAVARVPALPGMDLPGVQVFRTLDDALALRKARVRARQIVVLGGGILGLEIAASLTAEGVAVTVLEQGSELLPRQLDKAGSVRLQQQLAGQGVQVHTGVQVRQVLGDVRVTAVELRDGRHLPCDCLVLAVGIEANLSLAQAAGLATGRGVQVDDGLQTSDPHIFAVGDCAEHAGQMYGLLAPGYAQAEVLARRFAGEDVGYRGSAMIPQLKLPVGVGDEVSVSAWPAEQVLCHCAQVTHGQVAAAIRQGCQQMDALCATTGAAKQCGSCRPLLAALLGSQMQPTAGSTLLQWAAILTVFAGLGYLLLPGLGYQESVLGLQWDGLWRDPLSRQITGFTLLTIALLISFISIRKRVQTFHWGAFADWRLAHVLLGLLIIVTLLVHTGARFGENLNQMLMSCFIGVLLTGGLLSASIANEHRLTVLQARRLRLVALWLHLLLLWPLPALLGFHILKAYYF